MAGIIFTEHPLDTGSRGLSRRHLFVMAAAAVASIAVGSSSHVMQPSLAASPDAQEKLDGLEMGGPEELRRLLSLVPNGMVSPAEGNGVTFYYADLDLQSQATGLNLDPTSDEHPSRNSLRALYPLATASPAFERAVDKTFTTAIGFQPLHTGQTLLAGTPPDQLTLFQNGIELDQLPKAWEASGYDLVPTDEGAEIWTVGETGEIDLDSTMGAFVMPSLNNATALENGIVMFAHTYDRLVSAIDTANSGTGSMLDDLGIGAVVAAMPANVVSAIAVSPDYVVMDPLRARRDGTPDQEIEQDEGERMPEYRSFAMGITAGFLNPDFQPAGEGTPDVSPDADSGSVIPKGGVVFARLASDSEEDAALIAGIVEQRWREQNSLVSNRPYAELMTIEEAGAEGDVAAIDFIPLAQPSVWINLLLQRDLAPFAPST